MMNFALIDHKSKQQDEIREKIELLVDSNQYQNNYKHFTVSILVGINNYFATFILQSVLHFLKANDINNYLK